MNDEIAGCGCGVDVDWGAEVGGWSLEDEVVVSDAGGLTGSEGETRVAVYDQGEGVLVGLGGRRLWCWYWSSGAEGSEAESVNETILIVAYEKFLCLRFIESSYRCR